MTVMVLAELRAQPRRTEEIQGFIRSIVAETRGFSGFEDIAMHHNVDDPDHLLLVEQWKTREHHAKYLAWRTERGDFDHIVSMLAGPPTIACFNRVRI